MNDQLIKINPFENKTSHFPNNTQILTGRVVDIILDDKHSEFKRLGEWDSLGTIFFNESNKIISNNTDIKILPYAKPLYSYQKTYPLKNEIVWIIPFPSFDSQNNISLFQYYYTDIINIWNHPHHNALPQTNNTDENIDNNFNRDSTGNTKISKETSTKIDLGKEFKEKSNIKPLLPKEGDYIIESRFGSSIRFGSDKNGNPITIIRNGQNPNLDNKGWIPTKEDVNDDLSSIYFGNGDPIPIKVASDNLKSFNISSIKETSQKIQTIENNNINNETSPSQNIKNIKENETESINLNKPNLNTTSSFDLTDDFVVSEELFQESDWEKFEILVIDNTTNPIPNGSPNIVSEKQLTDTKGKKLIFKTSYPDLPYVQAIKRFYPKGQMVNEIKNSLEGFNIETKKAVWVIFYMENSGNTFNYNGWGVQTDTGWKWKDPEKAIVNQMALRNPEEGYRSFAGFKDLNSAIKFVALALNRKNISILTPNLVQVYFKEWVGRSISPKKAQTLLSLIEQVNRYTW